MNAVRKWLGRRIELSLRWGDLLAIVAFVIVINAVWPGVPVWVFFAAGFAWGFTPTIWQWIRRRRRTV